MNLSFIIPIYNEEIRLNKGLHKAINYLLKQKYSWELILINDGSQDKTKSIITNFISSHPRPKITLINSTKNFGKGHAIRLGIKKAKGKFIIFSDIDFSVPIRFINVFLNHIKSNDIVIGSRRLEKSQITKHQKPLRELLGHGFTKLSNTVLGLCHSDHTCGFKAFKNHAAKNLYHLQAINRWAFDSEILLLAKKYGYSVKEIPVTWKNDQLTKVNIFFDIIFSFLSLLQIKINDLTGKY